MVDETKTQRNEESCEHFVSPNNVDEQNVTNNEDHLHERHTQWKTPVKRNAFTVKRNKFFATIGSSEVLCYYQCFKVEYTSEAEDELGKDSNNVND